MDDGDCDCEDTQQREAKLMKYLLKRMTMHAVVPMVISCGRGGFVDEAPLFLVGLMAGEFVDASSCQHVKII